MPIVLASGDVFSIYGVAVNTSDVTKNGFSISARHTNDSGDPVSTSAKWVAIDISKLCIK